MRENAGDLCRADRSGMRQVSEPGGRLLVGLGAPGGALADAIGRRRGDKRPAPRPNQTAGCGYCGHNFAGTVKWADYPLI